MKCLPVGSRIPFFSGLAAAALLGLWGRPVSAAKGDVPAAKEELAARMASERKTVDLTVYNGGTSLVREERTIGLAKGANRVQVPDIPATIDPTSLHFSSLTDPAGVRVLEQNYQYDLVNQAKLLEKYLGRPVEFLRLDPEKKKEYTVTAGSWRWAATRSGTAERTERAAPPTRDWWPRLAARFELNPAGRLVLRACRKD